MTAVQIVAAWLLSCIFNNSSAHIIRLVAVMTFIDYHSRKNHYRRYLKALELLKTADLERS